MKAKASVQDIHSPLICIQRIRGVAGSSILVDFN